MPQIISYIKNRINLIERIFYLRIYINPKLEKNIVNLFHRLYYDSYLFNSTWKKTFWLGVPILKCPLDLWNYQEIIFETKPDLIIETGTAEGGSAFFLASLCDLIKNGNIISIDIIKNEKRPKHKRIKYLNGSSISDEIVNKVKNEVKKYNKVMVILDSDHHKEHVYKELKIYSEFVSKGCYLIVEDTNINGHPVFPDFGPGPMEAVMQFLKENKNFVIDKNREKFLLTFNPMGYLLRIK
uniref:Cephalosporin hydroxylase n=1 Tax=candidate division WOR-3 bacterium TaxID=2052148 RepID=A0A7C4U6Z2_UNCW3